MTYLEKISVVSGLYRSRPSRIFSMCSGRSTAASNAKPMIVVVFAIVVGGAEQRERGVEWEWKKASVRRAYIYRALMTTY